VCSIAVTQAGKVIYKSEHNAVGHFPEPGDGELAAGPSRNFQVFDPLDFLAEVSQHIPIRAPIWCVTTGGIPTNAGVNEARPCHRPRPE
jgi:hypothetical protein